MARRNYRPVGFDLINTPLGELPDSSAPSLGYPGFTMGKLFDGYIFLVPFQDMQGCTIDTSFFDGKDWEAIKTQVPDPDWRGQLNDLQEFWKQIKDFADIKKRYRDLLR